LLKSPAEKSGCEWVFSAKLRSLWAAYFLVFLPVKLLFIVVPLQILQAPEHLLKLVRLHQAVQLWLMSPEQSACSVIFLLTQFPEVFPSIMATKLPSRHL